MVSENTKLQQRPDGGQPEDYRDTHKWTGKRWAWAFLSRNKAFQAACKEVDALAGVRQGRRKAMIAKNFELEIFKDFREPYSGEGIRPPKFRLTSLAGQLFNSVDPALGTPVVIRPMKQPAFGEVVLYFDVTKFIGADDVLKAQLREARRILRSKAKELEELGVAATPPKTHKAKTRAFDQLPLYLEFLDRLAEPKETRAGALRKVFGVDPKQTMEDTQVASNGNWRIDVARRLTESGYIELLTAVRSKGKRALRVNDPSAVEGGQLHLEPPLFLEI